MIYLREEKLRLFSFVAIFYGVITLIFPLHLNVHWDQCVYLLHAKFFAGYEIGYNELSFRPILLSLLSAPLWKISNNLLFFKSLSILFSFAFVCIVYKFLRYYFLIWDGLFVQLGGQMDPTSKKTETRVEAGVLMTF